MRRTLATLLLAACAISATAQNLTITPTTTLAAETGNNTSSPAGFTTQSNGNIGGANVSKVDTHTLLYPGFSGKIYAHVVGWFGGSNHMNIGYNSADPAVVKAQLDDMTSRGIDGIIHVWYGAVDNISNNEAKAVMAEAANHAGFTFAIMIDQGAIKWGSCYPSCTATQAVINMTQYIAATYFPSPSYMRINGRPVLTNFDIDRNYSVDWNAVAAATPGNPIFLFQNNSGFTHGQSGGSYSWVMPGDPNYGLDYLGSFYTTGMTFPTESTVGATYKGFNDTLASWTMNRIMGQQCGQTWLQTFAKINSMYNSTNQLPAVQLVTWDDYEEGTEIETGIDNCVSVSASVSGSTLSWAVSGSESTIDHYTVFISTDGVNLMALGDFVAGTRSLDMASYSLAAGTYKLYVKAVGKPSLTNKMSNVATLTVAAPAGVTISSPVSGSTPGSPVRVQASATAPNGIASMITYLDDVKVYTTYSALTDISLPMAPGSRRIVINSWDTKGMLMQAVSTISVPAQAPTATLNLSATSVALGAAVSAAVSGTDPNVGGSISSSTINWGDGSSSAGLSASHTYAASGTYTVTATVTDNYGKSASASQALTVQAALSPTAAMTVTMSGATATVSTAASVAGSGTITSTVISWGDGATSTGPAASHTYATGGVFTITATVTNSYGKSSSTSQPVTAAGVVIWLPQPGVIAGQPVHISATAYDSKKIASMIVYMDGKEVYRTTATSVDTWLSMRNGTHRMVVKAWEDVTGVVYQGNVTFSAK